MAVPLNLPVYAHKRAIRRNMVTKHQEQALLTFRKRAMGWERAANFVGIGDATWDALVAMGYVEERRDGPGRQNRWLRLTEKGRRATDEGYY